MLLGSALYGGSLGHPFVYDDVRTVVDNGTIVTLRDPLAILQHEWTRPLTNLSFAVDHAIWGPAPFGFHLTNVVLHVLNTMLVFLIGLRMFRAEQHRATGAGMTTPTWLAGLAATLFACHPIMSEAVVYVSSRADLLCACFFLLALLAATAWLERGRRWTQVAMWTAWVLALLAKETAVVFPLVLLALTQVYRVRAAGTQTPVTRTLLSMHALMLIAAAARLFVLLRVEGGGASVTASLSSAVATGATALRLLCVPAGQSIFHAVVPLSSAADLRLWTFAAVTIVAGALLWRTWNHLGAVGFGLCLLAATLAPALFGSAQGTEAFAEHRLYLPAAGFLLLLASLVDALMRTTRPLRSMRLLVPLACVAVVLSLSGRTYIRTLIWADPLNLWQEAVTLTPSHWLPRAVLGETLHARAMHTEAVDAFKSSLAVRPDNEGTMLNLVVCLSELKRSDEALAVLSDYEQRVPDAAAVSIGRGAMAMIDGRPRDARGHFQHALDKDPRSAMARQWLALVAEQDADTGQLLNQCYELQRLTPGRAHVDACIAQMLALQSKEREEAR